MISDRQLRAWRFGAVAAPIAHLAAGCSWPVVLVSAAAAALVGRMGSRKRYCASWLSAIQWLLCIVAAAEAMRWMESFWQSNSSWIVLILLALAAWAAAKQTAIQAMIILLWFVGFLLGSVLISAIPEIDVTNLLLLPEGNRWGKGLSLAGVILLTGLVEYPADERENTGKEFPWFAMAGYALLCSVCTQGVLSLSIASGVDSPFYELSRSIRFYGAFQRFESLAVMGMMLGTFLYLAYLCTMGRQAGQRTGIQKEPIHIGITILGILILYGIGPTDERGFLTIGIIIVGYLLPWIGQKIAKEK